MLPGVVEKPSQRINVTSAMRGFLKATPKKVLTGVTVAGLDTNLTEEEFHVNLIFEQGHC